MPIPPFDTNSVLPPHLGDPRQADEISPYPCTALELCQAFATSADRVRILEGFLRLRTTLRQHGMTTGFQWIDGSFLEDIERTRNCSPADIDVVTFYWSPDPDFTNKLISTFPDIVSRATIKANFSVDHFPIDVSYDPEVTVEATRYWCGLFSHTRTGVWKGMLRIDLDTPADDATANALLATRP